MSRVKGPQMLNLGRAPSTYQPVIRADAETGWEGERASEGRGCLERGTLNADRKANRRRALPERRTRPA
jgi:hypothetical protein